MAVSTKEVSTPISEQDVLDTISFQRASLKFSSEYQSKVLGFTLLLANDPMFQATVERSIWHLHETESFSEAQFVLATIRSTVETLPLPREVAGIKMLVPMKDWLPEDAIIPAIDAVWRVTKNNSKS